MQKINPIVQDARTRPLAYVVQVVGVILVVLNLYLATKLQPIAKTAEVNAEHIEQLQDNLVGKVLFTAEMADIHNRLDRIENKLDRIIER